MENSDIISSTVADMTSTVTDMTSAVTDMTSTVTDMTSAVTDISSTISSTISSIISSTINSIISSTISDEMIGNNSQSQESEGYYSQLGTCLAVGFTICTLGAVCGLAYLYKKRTKPLEDKSSKNYEPSDLNCVKVDIPLQENEIKVDVSYEDNGNNESHIPSNDLDNNLLGVNVTEHLS
ncbi:Uncharacterised protein [Orientia tsutsugamushi]|uniref:Uncharacterized protein n=2 Tax=Orientia tsutsugamushi TaxID=784 RepID=A0A2U3RRG1_ORITS|nr:hypothetical protein [Orientia tsutsugamushi]KJV50787.1 hypothetical protein OTSKARP_1572 [Orientia tsutsugamushi str. Karp]SPR15767.1 Uncharacterised protein [Orientia tsutsugamushi]